MNQKQKENHHQKLKKMQNEKTKSAEKELTLIRIVNAPREIVFKAWTSQRHLAKWWGPKGFTNPVCEIDVQVGGSIFIEMQAPDGTIYPMSGIYEEIIEPRKIVFTSEALDNKGTPLFEILNTILFDEENGKTKLTIKADVIKAYGNVDQYLDGIEEGWSQSIVRLNDLSEKMSNNSDTTNRELTITRLLNAPRELVWKVFTEPGHIAKWWGPNGFTNTIDTMDVKPGGIWEFVMHGPDGTDYKNTNQYVEVVKPEKLTFNHISAPKFKFTITFTEQGNKTLLTWNNLFESAEELEQVVKVFKADVGMKQNVDKLEAYLKDHKQ
jgi:uncharacterized protein YndB with AHSA1/START domain